MNPKIIKIVLNTFFCNLDVLVKEQDYLKYYLTLSSYINDDVDISWNEIGSNYIIWQPFEATNPCDLLDVMINLYKDIEITLEQEEPNITINPLEVASELAHDFVVDAFLEMGLNHSYTDKNNNEYYNDDAQDLFNKYYTLFLDVLNSFKK